MSADAANDRRRSLWRGWDQGNLDLLVELINKGLPASRIAEEMGGGLTRNAIIGKAARLGLRLTGARHGPKPQVKPEPVVVKKRFRVVAPVAPAQIPAPVGAVVPDPLNVTFLELAPRSCRWPYDRPGGGFQFCGHAQQPGSAYCTGHFIKSRAVRREP